MSIGIIFKIAAVGILLSILSQLLKNTGKDELSHLLSMSGMLLVLFWILPYVMELFDTMQKLFDF